MTLPRTTAVKGMIDEYAAFAELIAELSDEEWQQPSRCEGWRVADAAAHVVGQLTDVVNFRLEGLGSPEATQRQVDERRDRSRTEVHDELLASAKLGTDIVSSFDDEAWDAPAPAGAAGTLGFGIEALWFDTYLHADDMRAALGRESVLHTDGTRASVSHIAQVLTDQGAPATTLALDGIEEFPVSGGGRRVTGDAFAFVLAGSGRGDLAPFGLGPEFNIYRD
ncbi:MAG: maleylpyruvate isomerase family mycothiol-dependent enzyme [Frankiales bacterium]|nr:maleylpyruvate isomerase family mycothiol-dependent enzyme [Frankiales bacterium]